MNWYDAAKKDPKTGKRLCPKCSTMLQSKDGKKEKLQDTLDSSWVCQFQEPEVERVVLKGYNCSLRTYGTAASLSAYRRPCNPEMCPMYQTWQLLKEK